MPWRFKGGLLNGSFPSYAERCQLSLLCAYRRSTGCSVCVSSELARCVHIQDVQRYKSTAVSQINIVLSYRNLYLVRYVVWSYQEQSIVHDVYMNGRTIIGCAIHAALGWGALHREHTTCRLSSRGALCSKSHVMMGEPKNYSFTATLSHDISRMRTVYTVNVFIGSILVHLTTPTKACCF